MTTPTQQSPGGQREDTALAVAAAVSTVMVGAQLLLLGQLSEAVRRLLAGVARRTIARQLHAAAMATVAGVVARVDRLLAAAQQQILAETTAVLNASLPSARSMFGVPVGEQSAPFTVPSGPVSPGWRQFLVRVREAALVAVSELDAAFTRAAAAARGPQSTRAVQEVVDELAARGLTVLTDTAGRTWALPVYALMATRTACSRLALATHFRLLADRGMDLVMVDQSSPLQGCPRCAPFEYRVLSLFGQTPTGAMVTAVDARGVRHLQPVLTTVSAAMARGLLHPSCRHFLVPFADGMNVHAPSARGLSYVGQQRQRALERVVRRETARRAVALTSLAKAQANRRLWAARSNLDQHIRTYHQEQRHPGKAG